ncbi:Transcription factor of morphogenesis MCM1 [Smittium culicis]|uniref:Transcription factor of morphogenesis MCM1 n=1 Tax=Smittium culicis TaxID=133412 RepID=A0A1R1Y3V2_9FUNG|nr:Transcription factor of morphogenesis MCM1 [Smittium culicis]
MLNPYTSQRKHPNDNIQQINASSNSESAPAGQQQNMIPNGRFLPQIQDNIPSNSSSSQASSNLKRNRQADANDSDQNDESGSEAASKEDSLATPTDKKTRRRKIKIEYIEDKGRRHITFSKRKAGIMKKAFELSTLTGTQVLLLVVSETGLVYTFTTPKLQPIVTKPEGKSLIQTCLSVPDTNENSLSSSSDPNSSNPAPNSSSNTAQSNPGPYIGGSRQHSVSGYPENIPNIDQGPFDEDRKLSTHNNTQPISSTNISPDQYFQQPYYNNNPQSQHHISNRSSHNPSSNGNNIYNQQPAFQPQLGHHGNLGNYVNPSNSHNSYSLQSSGHNPSQLPAHHQNNPNSNQQNPLSAGPNQNLNFQDIVANPSIPSISGFSAHQNPAHSQQHGPQNMIPQSQLYNGGYWQNPMQAQNMPQHTQNNSRQSYSGSIDKI